MTHRFELQGHRGARGLFPENTIEGFAATLALGVDAIEFDVAMTADGVPVVTHDPRLNPDITRGMDGAWITAPGPALLGMSFEELGRYDVGRLRPGSRYAALYPQQRPIDGARIPSLRSVFRLLAGTGVRIDAEVKTHPDEPGLTPTGPDLADAVVEEAEAAGVLGQLVVRSFDWRGLRYLRETRPEIPLVWLTNRHTVEKAALWWDGFLPGDHSGSVPSTVAAVGGGGAGWAPEHTDLTQAALGEAHSLGLRVLPWTVNHPEDMSRLIAWGVDGLCTDRPDLTPKT